MVAGDGLRGNRLGEGFSHGGSDFGWRVLGADLHDALTGPLGGEESCGLGADIGGGGHEQLAVDRLVETVERSALPRWSDLACVIFIEAAGAQKCGREIEIADAFFEQVGGSDKADAAGLLGTERRKQDKLLRFGVIERRLIAGDDCLGFAEVA